MKENIKEAVLNLSGNEPLMFSTPVRTKVTPHDMYETWIWGVMVGGGKVYVTDGSEERGERVWYELTETRLIQSIYQRVSLMQLSKSA